MYNLDDIEFSYGGDTVELTPSLALNIKLIEDNFEIPDYYGEFTDDPDENTIKVDPDVLPREYRDKGKLWFASENSLSEQRVWYRKHGYSKHEAYILARSHVVEDLDTYMRHYNGGAKTVGLSVEVIWQGDSIGQDSLMGIEQLGKDYRDDRRYLLETLPDVIYGAFSNALSWATAGLSSEMQYILGNYQQEFIQTYDKRKATIEKFEEWRKGKISAQYLRLLLRADLMRIWGKLPLSWVSTSQFHNYLWNK